MAAIEGSDDLAVVTAVDGVKAAQQLADEGASFDAIMLNLDTEVFDEETLAASLTPIQIAFADAPLLLLTACTAPECMTAAFQQGVRGYLTMETALTVTLDVIRLVCSGWMIYPAFRQESQPLFNGKTNARTGSLGAKLTPRQEEVLQCLATGMPNKRIAFQLNMSESTVKAHLKEIMQRIGATNRTQIVALLGKAGE